MRRTLLVYDSMQAVVGGDGMSVIVLTDVERKRAISVVCDEAMAQQLRLRVANPSLCRNMLPETLLSLLTAEYEMMVCGIYEGQYQVVLMDDIGNSFRIRMSDAVLLSLISDIPLYMENGLMERQCFAFNANTNSIAIPINTIDLHNLQQALKKAVADENYELASQLRDEINRRRH